MPKNLPTIQVEDAEYAALLLVFDNDVVEYRKFIKTALRMKARSFWLEDFTKTQANEFQVRYKELMEELPDDDDEEAAPAKPVTPAPTAAEGF